MRDDELDRMIDAGLGTYGEPHAGLERRVLAAMAAERVPHTPRLSNWRSWALGLSAAACVLIAVVVGARFATKRGDHSQIVSSNSAAIAHRVTPPIVRMDTPVRIAVPPRVRKAHAVPAARLPKKDLFPTLQPLSPEMKTLLQYAANAGKKERQALVQAHMDAPLNIAPLHIAPLNDSTIDGD